MRTTAATLVISVCACTAADLTDAEREEFLRSAKVVSMTKIDLGVTQPRRVTLAADDVTHDAHIQTVDVTKAGVTFTRETELNFRDSWEYNVAAYRLARLLGIGTVPTSVERRDRNFGTAAATWWVDGVMMDEAKRQKDRVEPPDNADFVRRMQVMRVFDELIYNTDRNPGNILITKDWKIWMIDHTRAFRRYQKLQNPNVLVRCERSLFEAMKRLDEPALRRELMPYVSAAEIRALLARRDLIVRHFQEKSARLGEEHVFFDLTLR
jgi:hypothetical protein